MIKLLPASIDDYDALEITTYEYSGGIALALRCSTDPEALLPITQYVVLTPDPDIITIDSLVPESALMALQRSGALEDQGYPPVMAASGMVSYRVRTFNQELIKRWIDCNTL